MSGHSKWSTIKRQKGLTDAKRGLAFAKLTNVIILAAKHGGGDLTSNFTLKTAVEKAKAANMPKENIERAIKRGTGELAGAILEEVLYEVIASHGVGLIIEAITDNKNRTTPEIKTVLTKHNAKLASTGAVTYQFDKMGKLLVEIAGKDMEELELAVIDAGVEDFEEQDEFLAVFTKPQELEQVKKALEASGLVIKESMLTWEPKDMVVVEDKEQASKIMNLIEILEDMDDVTVVHTNFDVKED